MLRYCSRSEVAERLHSIQVKRGWSIRPRHPDYSLQPIRMLDTGLSWRFGLLLLFLAAGAAVDWWRHPQQPTRWKEYSFLLACGLVGGVTGVAIDEFTGTLSPEYFLFGKGIPDTPQFRLAVAQLGFHSGLVLGLLCGGCLLVANQPHKLRAPLPLTDLIFPACWPIAAALALAPAGLLLSVACDPAGIAAQFEGLVPPDRRWRLLAVWGLHLGLYAGAVTGTLAAILWIRQFRIGRASSQTVAGERTRETPMGADVISD